MGNWCVWCGRCGGEVGVGVGVSGGGVLSMRWKVRRRGLVDVLDVGVER